MIGFDTFAIVFVAFLKLTFKRLMGHQFSRMVVSLSDLGINDIML